jgi:hypothetical protein
MKREEGASGHRRERMAKGNRGKEEAHIFFVSSSYG